MSRVIVFVLTFAVFLGVGGAYAKDNLPVPASKQEYERIERVINNLAFDGVTVSMSREQVKNHLLQNGYILKNSIDDSESYKDNYSDIYEKKIVAPNTLHIVITYSASSSKTNNHQKTTLSYGIKAKETVKNWRNSTHASIFNGILNQVCNKIESIPDVMTPSPIVYCYEIGPNVNVRVSLDPKPYFPSRKGFTSMKFKLESNGRINMSATISKSSW